MLPTCRSYGMSSQPLRCLALATRRHVEARRHGRAVRVSSKACPPRPCVRSPAAQEPWPGRTQKETGAMWSGGAETGHGQERAWEASHERTQGSLKLRRLQAWASGLRLLLCSSCEQISEKRDELGTPQLMPLLFCQPKRFVLPSPGPPRLLHPRLVPERSRAVLPP